VHRAGTLVARRLYMESDAGRLINSRAMQYLGG